MYDKENIRRKRAFLLFFFFSILLWAIPFLLRISLSEYYNFDKIENYSQTFSYENGTKSNDLNRINQIQTYLNNNDKFSAFKLVFFNNIKVCVINIIGGVTLGFITIINLIQNGFFTADIMANVYHSGYPLSAIIKHTLPHSFELLGTWLSGAIGFSFAKIIIDFIRDKPFPRSSFFKFIGIIFCTIIVITLIAAFIEVFYSINI